VKYLIIPDEDAALELMRAGKIDVMYVGSAVKAQALQKTNPAVQLIPAGVAPPPSIQMKIDKGIFSDIRVRKAMQLALDLPAIAKSYYQGLVAPYPAMVTSRIMKGWGFPYEEWPQDLKDEYAYNPTAAKKLLAEAGYPDGIKVNLAANSSADLKMLQIIKSYFSNIGIDLQIQVIEPDAWNDFTEKGQKADQLIYHAYGPFGHSFDAQRQIGRFRSMDAVTDALAVKANTEPDEAEMKQLLRDANERAARQHFAISTLEPQGYALCQPWFKGFSGQIHSVWMNGGGPCMASFYLGRFWIDQKLKKSLGY
jgi:ABC-type transport system substrate-binding protein